MPKPKLFPNEVMITVSLRLPTEMHRKLKQAALQKRRSLNQEILYRLQLQEALRTSASDETPSPRSSSADSGGHDA